MNYPWQFGMLQSSFIKREALLRLNCFPENLSQGEDRLNGIKSHATMGRGGPGYTYKILSYVGSRCYIPSIRTGFPDGPSHENRLLPFGDGAVFGRS